MPSAERHFYPIPRRGEEKINVASAAPAGNDGTIRNQGPWLVEGERLIVAAVKAAEEVLAVVQPSGTERERR